MKKNKNPKKYFDIFKKKNLVFFDNSASTLKPKVVCDAVDYYNRFESANAGRGVYRLSYEVTKKVETSRQKIKQFFGASNFELAFTKNTTEGINLVALGFLEKMLKEGDEIVISRLEHNSNYLAYLALANKKGAQLKFVETDDSGHITKEEFEKVLTPKTKFVALTLVSNTFGTKTQIKEIALVCKQKNIAILVDGSQASAHFKINLDELNVDFFVFSGYKMFAPTGVGGLLINKAVANEIDPVCFGGGMVLDVVAEQIETKDLPHRLEAGTLPIGDIIGLGAAVDFITDIGFDYIEARENELKEYFLKKFCELDGVVIYNKNPDVPIFLFNLNGVHAHDAATMYDDFNIILRAGNHCALLVNNALNEIATLRASLSFYNTFKDVDNFIFATKQIYKFFK
ncbi:MAG: cysteine desulfurase [Christensenellales bacterium]